MAFDISSIDKEIQEQSARVQRLQELRKVLSDADSVALLEQLFSGRNGHNGTLAVPIDNTPPIESPTPPRDNVDYLGLSQIDAVRRAIARHQSSFVVSQIGHVLRQEGRTETNIAVGRVLQRLEKMGELRVAVRGEGNIPNRYEKTEAFRPA